MDGNDAQHPEEPSGNWQFKPGDIVGVQPQAPAAPIAPHPAGATQPAQPVAPLSSATSKAGQGLATSVALPEASTAQGDMLDDEDDYPDSTYQADDTRRGAPEITWTASEYIAHSKGLEWYGLLAASAFALAAMIYLITRDKVSTGGVVIAAILFGIVAARKPRVLTYQLVPQGISVGARFYPFDDFKSFSIIKEGPITNITLTPMRRFMPPLSVYFAPNDEKRILNIISQQLPFLQDNGDSLDRFLRRIRF